jgi:periplasmic divalent cation tolerance protein
VRSIYLWDGKVCDDSEVLGIIKTTRERFDELGARYVELHPYDVPELIALPIVAGNAPYLDWLIESVS